MEERVTAGLMPEKVFYYFENLCRIPHGSGNTKEISDYLVSFAREHHLEYVQDDVNNVIIYKKGSAGAENAPAVILQGHMDMVCEARPDVSFDFEKDSLQLAIDGDYLHACGTTLGGDDGIAVAFMLAILSDDSLAHPPLEAVFTVDEEIGLLGAKALDYSLLKGRKMLNIDSEEEGTLLGGCAGGATVHSHIPVIRRSARGLAVRVTIDGLRGGHSGAEIDKNRANANVMMGRLLHTLSDFVSFGLSGLSGGSKDNAIPRAASADLLIQEEDLPLLLEKLSEIDSAWKKEYEGSDDDISVHAEAGESTEAEVLHPTSCEKVLFYLVNVPFGVAKMSGTVPGIVDTSSNVGIMKLETDEFFAVVSTRSLINTARDFLKEKVCYLTEFLGGSAEQKEGYPAWEFTSGSPLQKLMSRVYEKQYGCAPVVTTIHAGLECGLFYDALSGLDSVSFGPDILDIHTSEERLSVSSVQRVYAFLLEVLRCLSEEKG